MTEDFDSRQIHITKDGIAMQMAWTATWDEWDGYLTNNNLPKIGQNPVFTDRGGGYFTSSNQGRKDVKCTDVQVYAIDNVNCRIVALFSTENSDSRKEEEDVITSWDFRFDTDLEVNTGDTYYTYESASEDYVSETSTTKIYTPAAWAKKSFATEWVDTYGGSEDDTPPELVIYRPRLTMTVNLYGSKMYWYRISQACEGKVNSTNFVNWLIIKLAGRLPAYETPDPNDNYKWLCMNATVERTRYNCFNYEFNFRYNSNGWNKIRDANGSLADMKVYVPFNFQYMFESMDNQLNELP